MPRVAIVYLSPLSCYRESTSTRRFTGDRINSCSMYGSVRNTGTTTARNGSSYYRPVENTKVAFAYCRVCKRASLAARINGSGVNTGSHKLIMKPLSGRLQKPQIDKLTILFRHGSRWKLQTLQAQDSPQCSTTSSTFQD